MCSWDSQRLILLSPSFFERAVGLACACIFGFPFPLEVSLGFWGRGQAPSEQALAFRDAADSISHLPHFLLQPP